MIRSPGRDRRAATDDHEIIDFQLTARGAGAADIAYLISQGLPTAQRTGRDEELLREYLDLLAARGVHDYPFDLAWRDYRFAAAYMIVLPVVILIGWDSLPQRSRDLCVTLADRMPVLTRRPPSRGFRRWWRPRDRRG